MSDELMTAAASAAEPAEGLRAVRALRALADRLEALHVERARGAAGPGSRSPTPSGSPGRRSTRSTGRGSADVREVHQGRPRGGRPGPGGGARTRRRPDRDRARAARHGPHPGHGRRPGAGARWASAVPTLLAAVRALPSDAIDADALAGVGIDLDAVRTQVEASFGPGALDAQPPPQQGRPPAVRRRRQEAAGGLAARGRSGASTGGSTPGTCCSRSPGWTTRPRTASLQLAGRRDRTPSARR